MVRKQHPKILSNEKYKGDALLQKTYTVDFLSKKWAENDGDIPQYYVENSHPAIIDKDTWEAVQLEMERRRAYAEKHGIQKVDYASIDQFVADLYFKLVEKITVFDGSWLLVCLMGLG